MSVKQLWEGSRGERYLVVQGCLFLLLIFGPHDIDGSIVWRAPYAWIGTMGGGALFIFGVFLAAAGSVSLGKNLTPLPTPKKHATLVVTGVYRLVRHPIYSGILLMAFGWGMWLNSWLTVAYALLLSGFFDIKSRHEERLLVEKFPEYTDYRKNVKKLIPYLY